MDGGVTRQRGEDIVAEVAQQPLVAWRQRDAVWEALRQPLWILGRRLMVL